MKRVFLISILTVMGLVILPFADYALDETGEELRLYLGEVQILSVSNPTRVVIGNPAIVDVTNITKNELTLTPKTVGTTTLVFWDNFGEQSYRVKVFAENAQEIKSRIDNLLGRLDLPEVYTQIDEGEGKVFLMGRVKTPQDKEKISLVLGELKNKTIDLVTVKEEESVIEIEVQVLELDKDATATLGFTNPLASTITLTEVGSAGISDSGAKWSNLFKVLNLKRAAFSWTLDALVKEGKARILSQPRLACQSGKEAELLVGGEKPIFTTEVASAGGEGTNVEYKEFGIKLKMKPTVTDEEKIKLALNIEVSEVGTAETIGSSSTTTAKAYPLSKRSASTELYLNDGQTMAIGGLKKQKHEEDVTKTPFLGDIPGLGLFFRKKVTKTGGGSTERGDTELFITLTPTIISKEKPLEKKIETKKESPKYIIDPQDEKLLASTHLLDYISLVQRRILNNLEYPALAKKLGFQGTVKLSLHLSQQGELLDVIIKSSSGYKILDDNAVTIAKRVGSYPPFPSSIDQKDLWIDVPIAYSLN